MFSFYRSTVGKKLVVAATGTVLLGFVVLHMLGNLKTFLGVDSASGVHHLDSYAEFLRTMGQEVIGPTTALWFTRLLLLLCVAVHILTVYQLRRLNALARPVGYARVDYDSATLASRSMWWGGLLIALFAVFHILHFTTGQLHFDGFESGRVYQNVYRAFQHWYLVLIYLAAMLALLFHVFHGTWSLFQTLGIDAPNRNHFIRLFSRVIAFVLFLGFISVPVAVFHGLIPVPGPRMSQGEGK